MDIKINIYFSESLYLRDIAGLKKTARGAHGMTHGARPKVPKLDAKPKKADVVKTLTRPDGVSVTVTVPANWFTLKGAIGRRYRERYNKLVTEARELLYLDYEG